jgi:flagellar motor switch protein FliM
MADKLSQAEIDALLASMHPQQAPTTTGRDCQQFDFRRPSKFAREHIRSIEATHELFARRFAGLLTQALRAVVHVDPIAVDQITYEDYIRSMANPTVLGLLELAPLPGTVVIELSTQMALTLVDRMLGGPGRPVPLRRPTDLELSLVRTLLDHAATSLHETFDSVLEVSPSLGSIELNPHFVQAVAPSEMVLLLTYQISLAASHRTDGLLTLCYPFSTLQPALDRVEAQGWDQPSIGNDPAVQAVSTQLLRDHLPGVAVEVVVQLQPSAVPALDLATLRPGDVLRLEHRVGEPAIALVDGESVLEGQLGRLGRRLALQVSNWRVDT